MYNLSPGIRNRWDALFDWLARESGIKMTAISHAAPAPLSELWERPDVGAMFMCGYPWSLMGAETRPQPLAAPVSTASWSGGRPVYASHIVIAKTSGISDLKSARWGWTVRDSQSGYNAPREYLAGIDDKRTPPDATGPFLNPAGMIDAIVNGVVDVGAIDAYAYQLLEMHQPDKLAGLRIIATTRPAPFPLLVASGQLPKKLVETVTATLQRAHQSPEGEEILTALGLEAFVEPELSAYEALPARATDVDGILGGRW